MKPKQPKRIEAVRAWGLEQQCKWPYLVTLQTGCGELASLTKPVMFPASDRKAVRVRVLRESDYKRLVKAAKEGK